LHVVITVLGRPLEITIQRGDFAPDGGEPPVSADSLYRPGDVIFVHEHRDLRGREAVVDSVDESGARVIVSGIAIAVDDITLVSPLRRDPLADYLAAVRRVHPTFGQQRPLQAWVIEQLRRVDWNASHPSLQPGTSLAAEYAQLEAQIWDDCAASLLVRERELEARFSGLTAEAQVARWKTEWPTWVGATQHVEALPRALDLWPELADPANVRAMLGVRIRLTTRNWSLVEMEPTKPG
jgi:hypothetical protein